MRTSDQSAAGPGALQPACSLVFLGFEADAPQDRLVPALGKLLRLDEAAARKALAEPPLQLMQSLNEDKLAERRRQLIADGCRVDLDTVWRYRHWSLAPDLVEHIGQAVEARRTGVFALLHARPAPGHVQLERAARQLSNCRAWALNHGQVLLQMDGSAGAGRWLLERQEQLEALLPEHRDRLLLSSFAICPEDAGSVQDLLDLLDKRLIDNSQDDSRESTESPKQVLSRPLSGRAWARLVQLGLKPEAGEALDAAQAEELQRNWPIGQAMGAGFNTVSMQAQLKRIVDQYQAGSFRRVERCWDLIHHFDDWDKLPRLPGVALQAYELAQAPHSDADELGRVVRSDPALSARILSLVNSAHYGLGQKVDSVSHALVILGFDEVAELALLLGSEAVFKDISAERGQRLWRHSAVTADVARALAERLRMTNSPAVFTAALLHDVGKVVLYSLYPDIMAEQERIARANQLPMHEMEREYFGHDHASLGAALMRRWGLPETLCSLVEQHHGPLPGQAHMQVGAALIGLADHIALRLSRSERWADAMRLRRVQLDTLGDVLGEKLDLDRIDSLMTEEMPRLRSSRL